MSIFQVDASNGAEANVTVNLSTTSVVGGLAEGVLGCTTDLGEITLIQGWNWYTHADVSDDYCEPIRSPNGCDP